MAEKNPEYMDHDKTFKMGIAAIASIATGVVHRGSQKGPSGTSMVLQVEKGEVMYIPTYLDQL